jgi:hypothetical protein
LALFPDPFADPTAHVEPLDSNPFNDVSDPNPYGAQGAASVISLESGKYGGGGGASTLGGGGYGHSAGDDATFARREEELRRRDEEIRRRQEDLDRRERELDRTTAKPNWPPCGYACGRSDASCLFD